MMQTTLFGRAPAPRIDAAFIRARRHPLDREGRAWVDRVDGWVEGHESLFRELESAVRWHRQRRPMYERVVDVPRLLAQVPTDGDHPLLHRMADALSARYRVAFCSISLALYRDGNDSVAFHRDKGLRDLDEAWVAVVSLGGQRRFALRPHGGGPSRTFLTGWGDLYVMGGRAQRDFEHAIPKMAHADPRLAIMFRP